MCPHAHPPLADVTGAEAERVRLLVLNKEAAVQPARGSKKAEGTPSEAASGLRSTLRLNSLGHRARREPAGRE